MNKVLQAILEGVETVGVATAGPAGVIVDKAVRNIVAKQGDVDTNVLDAAEASIQVVEHIEGTEIADEVKFRAGIATVEAGFKLVRESLKVQPAA